MKKIRINELARELEVKAHEILDKLPELGVTEKKTHSSSIDEDVAVLLRRAFGSAEPEEAEPATREMPEANREATQPEKPEPAPETEAQAEPAPPTGARAEEAVSPADQPPHERSVVRPVLPIRPPLAHGGPQTPAPPPTTPAPVAAQPPAPEPTEPAVQPAPATPPSAPPSAPSAPQMPPAAVIAPGRPVPPGPKPLPTTPRPGQILSGPRQPFPSGFNEGVRAPGAPIMPRPPISRPAPGPQRAAPPAQQQAPPTPGAPRPPQARPFAGQPAARPVVPPRPDLAAKLAQSRPPASPTPGTPAPPRPGVPMKPPSSPVPGQPIYRGPIRPGQPVVAKTGVRPGMPGRPAGPRPMHPTSRRMEPPVGPPPPGMDQRRPQQRSGARPQRERPEEEKLLRPTRRSADYGPPPINRAITISEGITVKELSEKLDVKANLVIKKLLDRGVFATINQTLESKLATDLARDFGASTNTVTFEEEAMQHVEVAESDKDMHRRAPVVTIMGHVDHGKTSILDAIREANVAGREAGGITQHIGAYTVELAKGKIVFIDTPGHEAFTRMRARGAKVTDIVVLVVAADDGVMPQTLEAIDHARAAKVPIIVAINKIDKPDAQPDRIKQQLSDRGLLAEEWGGDTVMVPVSAKMKTNLDLLLEMILLVSDMQDLKANPNRPAMGTVLEAKLDRGRGPVPTVLVRNGTLKVGDYFICGAVFGKVRAMFDDRGQPTRDAEPSTPVEVLGLESLPEAGDDFQVVTDTAKAKQIVLYREAKARDAALAKSSRITLEQLHKQMKEGEVKELPIILKTDVGGSAEVLTDSLQKLSNDKVKVRVLHGGVGAINETDVLLASASDAIVIGFNVRPERNASALAEQEKVDIRLHTIIYNLTDEIKRAMSGLLSPVFKEVYKGRAEVRETFHISKVGSVAGCIVQDGTLTRNSEVRLLRDNVVVYTGKISSLRRFKDDVGEVRSGQECGITLENYSDVKQGDVIEGFVTERVATEVFA
ncbi:MAG TPA: translation initiation factor IF-2 [Bryobacteraceae bacterium]|nr:translation initiation factor IF-2 [Bryobacteraceae bacterium]